MTVVTLSRTKSSRAERIAKRNGHLYLQYVHTLTRRRVLGHRLGDTSGLSYSWLFPTIQCLGPGFRTKDSGIMEANDLLRSQLLRAAPLAYRPPEYRTTLHRSHCPDRSGRSPSPVVAPTLALPCPAPPLTPQRPANGVEIDAWKESYLGGHCFTRQQGGLTLCIDESSPESILFVKVTEPGGQTVGVQIGLAGDGKVARTILGSLGG